jgi:hypothetical protein
MQAGLATLSFQPSFPEAMTVAISIDLNGVFDRAVSRITTALIEEPPSPQAHVDCRNLMGVFKKLVGKLVGVFSVFSLFFPGQPDGR